MPSVLDWVSVGFRLPVRPFIHWMKAGIPEPNCLSRHPWNPPPLVESGMEVCMYVKAPTAARMDMPCPAYVSACSQP